MFNRELRERPVRSHRNERHGCKSPGPRPRVGGTQATERQEVAEGQNDNAQLWEVSDIRDDLDSQASTELDQVNQALARLDTGEYGLCTDCDEPIAEARLKALPYATLCIQCAEEAEQPS